MRTTDKNVKANRFVALVAIVFPHSNYYSGLLFNNILHPARVFPNAPKYRMYFTILLKKKYPASSYRSLVRSGPFSRSRVPRIVNGLQIRRNGLMGQHHGLFLMQHIEHHGLCLIQHIEYHGMFLMQHIVHHGLFLMQYIDLLIWIPCYFIANY